MAVGDKLFDAALFCLLPIGKMPQPLTLKVKVKKVPRVLPRTRALWTELIAVCTKGKQPRM